MRIGEFISGPGHPDKTGHTDSLFLILPRQDLGEGVGTSNEEQLRARTQRSDITNRVDRVGRAWAIDVDATYPKPRVGRGRNHRHQVAMLGRTYLSCRLLPRR